jgi:hypothetical protein
MKVVIIGSERLRARLDEERRREAGEDLPWMGMFGEF